LPLSLVIQSSGSTGQTCWSSCSMAVANSCNDSPTP
jgi:hypothetical protein